MLISAAERGKVDRSDLDAFHIVNNSRISGNLYAARVDRDITVAFGYTPAGYKPHVERQLFGFEYRLGRRDGLFRETQTILRDNVIVLIAQRELRFLNIGRVNGLILAELDPYMVYLVYYLLRPVNRECFGIKNKFLGYAALGNGPFKAALNIDRFAAVFNNGEIDSIWVFAHNAYLVFIDIVRKNELVCPCHIIRRGYAAYVDNSLNIRGFELRYSAAVSFNNDAD